MLTSMAEEEPMTVSPYYKSVEIKDGDNLWNIARQYKREAVCLQKNTSGIKTNEFPFALIRFIKASFLQSFIISRSRKFLNFPEKCTLKTSYWEY